MKTYNVQVFSGDGGNLPIHLREVSDADIANWESDLNVQVENGDSRLFNIGDKVLFCCMPEDYQDKTFPGIPCEILAIHFFSNTTKYDLDLLFVDNQRSRIYNVDSALVVPRT